VVDKQTCLLLKHLCCDDEGAFKYDHLVVGDNVVSVYESYFGDLGWRAFTIFIIFFLENMPVTANRKITIEFLNLIAPTSCDIPLHEFNV
jgi:hypothetical protein